jgi:Sugar kinases, ribokinase family
MTAANTAWKVAFIGECMIELFRSPDGVIRLGYAGDTFNSAAYFSRTGNRFGMKAEYVSALGDDSFSAGMRALWASENVSSDMTRSMPGRLPGLHFVDVDAKGERSFTYWRGEAAVRDVFEEGSGDEVLEKLADFDAIYFSGISLAVLRGNGRDRLLTRLEELNKKGVRVFFDCNFRPRIWTGDKTPAENARPWYERVMACADTVFISRDEIATLGFGPETDPGAVCAAIRTLGTREAVVKDGSGACVIEHADGTEVVPACVVETVVDTTAAGDSFSAAYMVCRRLGLSPKDSAERSHKLAACVVTHKGAIMPKDATPDLFPDM